MLAFAVAVLISQSEDFSVSGPGLACGSAFAVQLKAGERLSWTDHKMDFITYRFTRAGGSTTIYEGNFPQPGGIVFKTGKNWPAEVVVHDTAEVAKRVLTDTKSLTACQTKGKK